MALALVGLLAVAALVVATMSWHRHARTDQRLDHIEDEIGREAHESESPLGERRPAERSLRDRVRKLEVAVAVVSGLVRRIRER